MKIQHLDEKFSTYRLHESELHKVTEKAIRDALNSRVKELIDQRVANSKPYELALIDEIKSQFAVKNHRDVIDCDIVSELNISKNPYKVVDKIIKSINPKFLGFEEDEKE